MNYTKFLECQSFQHDFKNFCYDPITEMSTYDELDFWLVDDHLIEQLIKFFKTLGVHISEVFNYPKSYIMQYNDYKYEYFCPYDMIIEILEILYDYTENSASCSTI